MSKNRKAKLIEKINGNNLFIIASVNGEDEIHIDTRSKRLVEIEQGQDTVFVQELNMIEFSAANKERNSSITYLAPNNVGILLSIANKALTNAQTIFDEKIDPNKHKHLDLFNNSIDINLIENTQIVYEFIESIQTSIVFGYTAIEAFTNLSIDEDYQYKKNIDNKGIIEVYDKKAIERWISLKVKISEILSEIYECKSIKRDIIWNQFLKFEECRNQIIHQKSINVNSLYEEYFNQEIFELCIVPQKVIKFFLVRGKEKDVTNTLWPVVVDADCDLPISKRLNAKLVKYVGTVRDY